MTIQLPEVQRTYKEASLPILHWKSASHPIVAYFITENIGIGTGVASEVGDGINVGVVADSVVGDGNNVGVVVDSVTQMLPVASFPEVLPVATTMQYPGAKSWLVTKEYEPSPLLSTLVTSSMSGESLRQATLMVTSSPGANSFRVTVCCCSPTGPVDVMITSDGLPGPGGGSGSGVDVGGGNSSDVAEGSGGDDISDVAKDSGPDVGKGGGCVRREANVRGRSNRWPA